MKIITQDGNGICLDKFDKVIVNEADCGTSGKYSHIEALRYFIEEKSSGSFIGASKYDVVQKITEELGIYKSSDFAKSVCRNITTKWANDEKLFEMPKDEEPTK